MSTTFVPTPTSRCIAGLGRVEITPPIGIYHRMWGAAKHDRAAGVHRPLMATALVLEPIGGNARRHVLVALDHCLLRPEDMDEFHASAARSIEIDPSQLTVVFSHTHSGGLLVRTRSDLPGGELIAPYLDELPLRVAVAVREAQRSARPAVLTYAATQCTMAHNRDFQDDANGIYVCGFNPDDARPQTRGGYPVQVVRMTVEETGERIGTIVNYPCHPTTLAWDNAFISPDYVGALRETVESVTDAPCLFLLGPCGDVGPRHGFVGDVAAADANGRQLGYAALSALESLPKPGLDHHYMGPVVSGATIGAWEFRPHSQSRKRSTAAYREDAWEIPLEYRADLPSIDAAEAELKARESLEAAAKNRGDDTEAIRLRALVERQRRLIERIRPLPAGKYPYRVSMRQFGDAIWIELEGEPYFYLQDELQRRFPQLVLIFEVLAHGTRPSYLPRREDYSKQLYQVEVSLLAAGSLERIVDEVSTRLSEWTKRSA